MLRRPFLSRLAAGTTAVVLPQFARAQRPAKVNRVGFAEAGAAAANQHFVDAFTAGMRELGYVAGQNLIVETRWAEGRAERFPEILAELVRGKPDVIVVASSLGAVAARKVVTSIPVVFVGVSDPVTLGLVESLAHPGGNMTGLSRVFGEGLLGKALQLLKELVPKASRAAILWNPAAAVESRLKEAQAAMRTLGMTPLPVGLRDVQGIDDAFAQMHKQHADTLLVITDPLTLRHRDTIVTAAAAHRIPTVYEFAEFARAGGLVAYSASVAALFRRAATYVDKILKGAAPGDMPIEQPTQFELVVNVKTATALGLTVPQSMLLRADEVIQ